MGSKKRASVNDMEDIVVEGELDSVMNKSTAEPSKKKIRKEKKKGGEKEDAAPAVVNSVKPMESKKKRKALDKKRHYIATENMESKSKQVVVESREPMASSSGSLLPEFHISVFKDLSDSDPSVRETAAEALVQELREVQKAYDRLEDKEQFDGGLKLEAEKDDGLNNCAPSVRYAVRRLIRGVSSSRECARQGFALGLTILVGTVSSIRIDSLLKLIVNLLEVTSSMKGQEARDCLLGRLFAYGALARSGRLIYEWQSNKSTMYIKEFIGVLISMASKKRYLQEPAVSIILELAEKLPTESLLSHVLEAPGLREWFEGAIEVGNPDALLLALKIQEKVPTDIGTFGPLLPNPFSPIKLFAADHVLSIVSCLKESTFCQPRVHGVWPVLVNLLLPDTVLQTEDAVSASSSYKKEKSTDCESALIPLLCVHG